MRHVFQKCLALPAPAADVFAWHEQPGALKKLIPPGEPIQVLEHVGGIGNGARVVLRMGYGPLAIRWVAVHQGYEPGVRFQDKQQSGPFRYWLHTHTFEPAGDRACMLCDHIEFELPLSPISDLAIPLVRRKLEATFAYRHRTTLAAFT